jgi:hypothetical protein
MGKRSGLQTRIEATESGSLYTLMIDRLLFLHCANHCHSSSDNHIMQNEASFVVRAVADLLLVRP